MKVQLTDGTKENINVPQHLPWKVGKKVRETLDVDLEMQDGKRKVTINNSTKQMSKVQDIIVTNVVPEEHQGKLSTQAVDKICDRYWPEIQKKMSKSMNQKSNTSSKQEKQR